MIMTSMIDMDATSIAEKIKQGQLTSEEVVQHYIKHIKKVNPAINALVEDRFSEALEEAKSLDQQLQENGVKGPLHGVPISVKEAFHVINMTTTGGLEHRQDLIARQNAVVIERLKKAGAVILGKTNTPTLCFSQETENKLYGRTNNPWDISKTAGGSSGGEGALLAVGGAAVGLGSDIGGSIRIPAHFNGVIGFKPGMNTVSSEGHFPEAPTELQQRMLAVGPMGKSVQDMRLMYEIITESKIKTRHLMPFRIEILPSSIDYPLSDKTKEVLDSLELFLERSFSTKRTVPPFFEESARLWQDILAMEENQILEREAFGNDRSGLFRSFMREKLTQRTKIHPSLSWGIVGSKLFKPSIKRIREVNETLEQGDIRLNEYLKGKLIIFPVYHTAAPNHGKVYHELFSVRKSFLNFMPYVAFANVWGLPSLTVPVSEDENGLPISIQIMSSIGNEDAIFRLGRILEKRFRGYKRCTSWDEEQ
ncbi:amidase [Oceanobacillus piezotolerans]|uniref:Amidase n=1 Tax=Oceanobacillus piezotolerans TaxID=2448030 RepID=A0A498DJ86_9BACI|nr:amidase [Oceanobacillus piezotolerans]RLL46502.1 amidase [Oceanobacillus piezotolerans]